jgi:hypothetical protein
MGCFIQKELAVLFKWHGLLQNKTLKKIKFTGICSPLCGLNTGTIKNIIQKSVLHISARKVTLCHT